VVQDEPLAAAQALFSGFRAIPLDQGGQQSGNEGESQIDRIVYSTLPIVLPADFNSGVFTSRKVAEKLL
jgi:hypothetical protein